MSAPAAPTGAALPAGLRSFSLDGRVAAVTGPGRGIGRAIAVGLAAAGADVLLVGRPSPGMERVCRDVVELGRRAEVVEVDLADPAAVAASGAALGDVDVLVNSAGVIERGEALDVDLASWSRVMDVNLTSVLALTQRVAAPMLRRGSGKVINVASLLSFQGGVRVAAYAASKHAVVGLTRALSNEWSSRGVQVNAIAPGYVVTDNTSALRADPDRSAEILGRIPAGRWADPADLVGAAVFLASGASDYVSGHVLVVDGGWSAR